MFGYFYHEILRKTVIGFGTLFNEINIKHKKTNGTEISTIKVPLSYGPTQKFLARLEQSPNLNQPVQMTLPRMSFELTGLTYDPARKVSTTQTFNEVDSSDNKVKKVYMPVPYNMIFELSVMTKTNDDMLQIIEQILPYFQPNYNLTIKLISNINEKRDIPIVLDNITMQDTYEGNFTTRRSLIYTLRFTAKTYLFGPLPTDSSGIIKKVTVDSRIGLDNPSRQMRYTVTPKATQDYNNDIATYITEDLSIDDNYVTVSDGSIISANTYITINDESMFVKSKSNTGNKIAVERTQPVLHSSGSAVNLVTTVDNNFIEPDDDFGFNESMSFLDDLKQYSTSLNEDIDL